MNYSHHSQPAWILRAEHTLGEPVQPEQLVEFEPCFFAEKVSLNSFRDGHIRDTSTNRPQYSGNIGSNTTWHCLVDNGSIHHKKYTERNSLYQTKKSRPETQQSAFIANMTAHRCSRYHHDRNEHPRSRFSGRHHFMVSCRAMPWAVSLVHQTRQDVENTEGSRTVV